MKTGSFVKRAMFVGAACAAMFVAPVGQAGTLTIDGINGEGVTLIGAVTGGTTAGTFHGTFETKPIYFWCIDLLKHVSVPGGPYTDYTAADFQSAPLTFTEATLLKTLFSQAYAVPPTSAHAAAAFQVAIWDVIFDDDFKVATGGAGFGIAPSGTLIADAQALVDSAIAGPTTNFLLTQLTSPSSQNFITPRLPRIETPEPTGLALLGAGLVAMMFGMRRRKSGGQAV
jgi:hypothetical protein